MEFTFCREGWIVIKNKKQKQTVFQTILGVEKKAAMWHWAVTLLTPLWHPSSENRAKSHFDL
jgi:hypothetical protein